VLDFFDTFARKQASNPLILDLILPLLQLVRSSGPSESDLSTKATSILKSRLGKAKDSPSPSSSPNASEILSSIHEIARKSPNADFCALCSTCSLFVSRACEDGDVVETYKASLEDYMTRKTSLIHPPFISDLLRRYPVRAWGLHAELVRMITPRTDIVNKYRLLQAYTIIQVIGQQLVVITKTVDKASVTKFISAVSSQVYATLESASEEDDMTEDKWTGPRLKDVVKVALNLARSSKNAIGVDGAISAWKPSRLEEAVQKFKAGKRTGEMKGVSSVLLQLEAILRKGQDGKSQKKKGKAIEAVDEDGDVKMDEAESKEGKLKKVKGVKSKGKKDAEVVQTIGEVEGAVTGKKEKKRKSIDNAGVKEGKVEVAAEKPKKAKKVKPSV
jgi:DNA polymerase phi